MSEGQIKALLNLREEKIDQVGAAIDEKPNRISDTISRARRNERIRRKLARHLNLGYEALWGEPPAAKRGKGKLAKAA